MDKSGGKRGSAPSPRKVLLLGVEGAFGWEMRQTALRLGHDVSALALSRMEAHEGEPQSPVVDLTRPDSYASHLEGRDLVIDCAGLAAWGRDRDPRRHGRHTLAQAASLLSASAAAGVKRVVFLGDANWFADADPERDVLESNPLCRRGYGRALASVWPEFRAVCRNTALGVRVHPGRIYGWGSWFLQQVVNPLKYEGRAHLVGDGSNWISPIHSQDLALALLAAEHGTPDTDYLAANEPIRLREFVRMAAHYMGIQTPPRIRAFWHARLESGLMSAENEICSARVSSARAHADLHWTPQHPSPRTGLPQALKELGVLAWK